MSPPPTTTHHHVPLLPLPLDQHLKQVQPLHDVLQGSRAERRNRGCHGQATSSATCHAPAPRLQRDRLFCPPLSTSPSNHPPSPPAPPSPHHPTPPPPTHSPGVPCPPKTHLPPTHQGNHVPLPPTQPRAPTWRIMRSFSTESSLFSRRRRVWGRFRRSRGLGAGQARQQRGSARQGWGVRERQGHHKRGGGGPHPIPGLPP